MLTQPGHLNSILEKEHGLIKTQYPCSHHKNAFKRYHTLPQSSNKSAIKTGDHS